MSPFSPSPFSMASKTSLTWERPSHVEKIHGVEIHTVQKEVQGETIFRRTYKTPVGSIYDEFKNAPGTGAWKLNRGWRDITPWHVSRLIKQPEDYKVMKYIVENTEYAADYFPVEQAIISGVRPFLSWRLTSAPSFSSSSKTASTCSFWVRVTH